MSKGNHSDNSTPSQEPSSRRCPDSDAPTAIQPPPTATGVESRRADVHRQRLEDLVRRANGSTAGESSQRAEASPRAARQPTSIAPTHISSNSALAPPAQPSGRPSVLALTSLVALGAMLGGLAALHVDRALHEPPVVAQQCGEPNALLRPPAAEAPVAAPQVVHLPPAVATSGSRASAAPALPNPARHQNSALGSKGLAHPRAMAQRESTSASAHPHPGSQSATNAASPVMAEPPLPGTMDTSSLAPAGISADPYGGACSDPERVQVPTQLHPRVNALMTSSQVFATP